VPRATEELLELDFPDLPDHRERPDLLESVEWQDLPDHKVLLVVLVYQERMALLEILATPDTREIVAIKEIEAHVETKGSSVSVVARDRPEALEQLEVLERQVDVEQLVRPAPREILE